MGSECLMRADFQTGAIKIRIDFQVQFSSFAQSCPTLCDLINCSTPRHPVHHQLLELAQTHVH